MNKLLEEADKLTDEGRAFEAIEILREMEKSGEKCSKIAELFGASFSVLADAEKAAAAYLDAAGKDKFLRSQKSHIASYLFILHYLPGIDTEDLYREQANFAKLFEDVEAFSQVKYNHKKIKIGYLLPNPVKSSLSNFIVPLFTKYDKNSFEVYVYAFEKKSDEFSILIKNNVDCFKTLDIVSYYDAANIIKSDEIDILFDLSAYGFGGDTLSILAYRPSSLQILGIGWPGAVNLPFVDYVLADDFLFDTKMQDNLLKIKNALCFKPDSDMLNDLRKPKKADVPLTLGVFNNFMKITDEALTLWNEILNALPNAVLTLQDTTIYSERISFMQNRLKKLHFSDRVVIKTASENYLSDMANTDIILDTFPYTGGFMTAAAICLGTPVVTLSKERFSSKFSADILKTAGLGEFITHDKNEYKNRVINIFSSLSDKYHKNLREKVLKSELCDEKAYMRRLEEAYNKILNLL